jgi:hypothetical protein
MRFRSRTILPWSLVLLAITHIGCAVGRHADRKPSGRALHPESVKTLKGDVVEWQQADGLQLGRMAGLVNEEVYYSTTWHRAEGDLFVVAYRHHMDLFGDAFQCEVFDPAGTRVATGTVNCHQRQQPFCLLETKAPAKPNAWELAVGFLDQEKEYQPGWKLVRHRSPMLERGDHESALYIYPVVWRGERPSSVSVFSQLPDLDFRIAQGDPLLSTVIEGTGAK